MGATPPEVQLVLVVVVYMLVATETERTEMAWLLTTGVKAMQFALVQGVDGCLVSIETINQFLIDPVIGRVLNAQRIRKFPGMGGQGSEDG